MAKKESRFPELAQLFTEMRRYFVGVGAFSFVINLLQFTAPLYMLQVYDRVLSSHNTTTLLVLTILVVGLFLLMAVIEFIRSRVLVRVGAAMEAKINQRIFDAAFEATLRRGGANARQALSDLTQLRQFVTGNGPFAFFDAPWFPIYLAACFVLHPLIGWFSVGAALILIVLTVVTEVATQKPLAEANKYANQATNFAHNQLANAEVVEAMGMLPALRQRWKARHVQHLVLQAVASDRAGLISAITRFVRITSQSLVLGLGAWLVLQNELTPGAMIVGSILMGRALAPIDQLIANWRGFVQARLAYERLGELLTAFPARPPRLSLPPPKGHVSVEGVVAVPPGSQTPVVRGVTMEIPPGTVVGVIGPSGSGKSTLARLLVGVWAPAAGKVRLDGADVTQWDKAELGPYIGYLPQDIELFDGTIAENIARFGPLDSERIVEAAQRAGVHDLILRLPQGYDTPIGPGGMVLSGGQRQRVALARALYGDVRLIVLDEPNSNLDDIGETLLVRALAEMKRQGRTVVVITHRTSVLQVVDRLAVMRDGMLHAYGPRDQVLAALQQAAQQAQQAAQQHAAQPPAAQAPSSGQAAPQTASAGTPAAASSARDAAPNASVTRAQES
ncbi:type I secretion system permease/ATPase [Hydrogenophilus thermoluteolus]|nr:type I secretion system permease/ATPase [Hydrogenophilus thermoluteolus]MBW7656969.1 type I secretion system permease/ATPase [Hydrogenophilus thermoluteolus]HNQ48119.1 type I secretion system permease/ATPase [Hydrogenophilus thermoluteolus]HNU19439.1 type I secretion system permease/ATPase [Hydrogenophilus thermoluteolus]